MANQKKIGGILKTTALALALLFFIVIAALQIYEFARINNQEGRIVLGVNGTGNETFNSALKGKPIAMGNMIGVVSGGNFMIVDRNANTETTENFMLTDPIMHGKGNYCIVADYGTKRARLYEKGQMKQQIETTADIISVVTNANGFYAIATKEENYNAVITVYKKNGEAIYRYNIAKNTFVDMDISANNRELVIIEANLSGGKIGSNLVLVEFSSETAKKNYYVESTMYAAVHFNKNNTFVALGNEKVDLYGVDAVKQGEISFKGRKLLSADITTDDLITLAFAKSDLANDGSVVEVYDRTGEMKFGLDFKDNVNHVCVNGKYISVAHGDNVDILKRNGKIKKSFETTTAVKYAAPFSNGKSAIVFSGGNTSVMQ